MSLNEILMICAWWSTASITALLTSSMLGPPVCFPFSSWSDSNMRIGSMVASGANPSTDDPSTARAAMIPAMMVPWEYMSVMPLVASPEI